MRVSVASTSSLIVASLFLGACHVAAQEAGDPVTYTTGSIVYSAVLDPDLDTVSPIAVSTVVTDTAALGGAAGAAPTISTATNADGDTITYSDGVPIGTATAAAAPAAQAPVAAQTTTSTARNRPGVSLVAGQTEDDLYFDEPLAADMSDKNDASDFNDFQPAHSSAPVDYVHFQTFARRSPTPSIHSPDQQRNANLEKRQAALGGGAGDVQTTQTALQVISGYNPPANTEPPEPTDFSSGTILAPSDIPGYTGKENAQGISSSSNTIKLNPYMLAVGCLTGAAAFVFGL